MQRVSKSNADEISSPEGIPKLETNRSGRLATEAETYQIKCFLSFENPIIPNPNLFSLEASGGQHGRSPEYTIGGRATESLLMAVPTHPIGVIWDRVPPNPGWTSGGPRDPG